MICKRIGGSQGHPATKDETVRAATVIWRATGLEAR